MFRFFRSRLSKVKAKYIESWYNSLSETYENKKTPNLTVKIQATFWVNHYYASTEKLQSTKNYFTQSVTLSNTEIPQYLLAQ